MLSKSSIVEQLRDHAFTLAFLVAALLARNFLLSKNLPWQPNQNHQLAVTPGEENVALSFDR